MRRSGVRFPLAPQTLLDPLRPRCGDAAGLLQPPSFHDIFDAWTAFILSMLRRWQDCASPRPRPLSRSKEHAPLMGAGAPSGMTSSTLREMSSTAAQQNRDRTAITGSTKIGRAHV